jgi:hypothetical protein
VAQLLFFFIFLKSEKRNGGGFDGIMGSSCREKCVTRRRPPRGQMERDKRKERENWIFLNFFFLSFPLPWAVLNRGNKFYTTKKGETHFFLFQTQKLSCKLNAAGLN